MLDQVGAMLVVVVVRNIQAHFMHPCSPGEQLPVPVLIQAPRLGHLVERLQCLGFDSRGLFHVDVVALHQEAQRAVADVLVMVTA